MDAERALQINSETPYMVIDLDQTKENLHKFQEIANKGEKALRPHSKTHKIPYLSRLQITEGAVGICVQKVSEAEVMFSGGISNILISNEVVDRRKCDRIARLSEMGCKISVAVDSIEGARNLSLSASYLKQTIPILIDINIGMNRCGVDVEEVEELHAKLKLLPNLTIVGIMAYDGHVSQTSSSEREKIVETESTVVLDLFKRLKQKDENIKILTVGGTPSSEIWSRYKEVTEIQPGTYVFYDVHCMNMGLCTLKEISMGVVGQVMSMKDQERIILDAGYKSISLDQGAYPIAIDHKGIVGKIIAMSEEHTVIKPERSDFKIGSKVLLLPYHSCTTTDLWDYVWIFEVRNLPIITKVMGRGMRT